MSTKNRSGVFAVTVAVRRTLSIRAISPKNSPGPSEWHVLPALADVDLALDDDEELVAESSLVAQNPSRRNFHVLGGLREREQILLRQSLEERRARERLGLRVVREELHATEEYRLA